MQNKKQPKTRKRPNKNPAPVSGIQVNNKTLVVKWKSGSLRHMVMIQRVIDKGVPPILFHSRMIRGKSFKLKDVAEAEDVEIGPGYKLAISITPVIGRENKKGKSLIRLHTLPGKVVERPKRLSRVVEARRLEIRRKEAELAKAVATVPTEVTVMKPYSKPERILRAIIATACTLVTDIFGELKKPSGGLRTPNAASAFKQVL